MFRFICMVSVNKTLSGQKKSEGSLTVSGITDRGGHSTYRIFLPAQASEEQFAADWIRLQELGCTYERATRRLVAIDVPPQADVYAVYDALARGEKQGRRKFEEGHCGRPLRERAATQA